MSINKITLPDGTVHNLVPGAGDIVVKSKLYFEAVNEDNVTYKKLVAEYVAPDPEDIDTTGTLTIYDLSGNAMFTMDMNGNRFNSLLRVVNTLIAGTLRANNLTANSILVSDADKNIVSSGYEFDISTNNTSDTWLLVMNGSKIQHRLTTSLPYVNVFNGATTTLSSPNELANYGDAFAMINGADGNPYGFSRWMHYINMTWDGPGHASNWIGQIAMDCYGGDMFWRASDGDVRNKGWKALLDSGNYMQFALPLSGGNVTGEIRFSNKSKIYNTDNTLILGSGDGVSARKYDNFNTYILMSASGFVNQSSRLVKENVEPITEERAKKILNLNVVSFDYIEEVGGEKNKVGLIAEDTLDILPDVVTVPTNYNEEETKQKIKNNEAADVMSIDYSKLTPYLVKMVQIQQRQIEELKAEVERLKDVIES